MEWVRNGRNNIFYIEWYQLVDLAAKFNMEITFELIDLMGAK